MFYTHFVEPVYLNVCLTFSLIVHLSVWSVSLSLYLPIYFMLFHFVAKLLVIKLIWLYFYIFHKLSLTPSPWGRLTVNSNHSNEGNCS